MPILLFLGPQGAGKGTQARLLSLLTGWQHVDAGSLLRRVSHEENALGRAVHERISKGLMVPDELITQIILTHLSANAILDGYPRNLQQYELFKHHGGRIDLAVYIHITDDEAVRRLSKRRVCQTEQGEWTFIAGDHEAEERCKKQKGRIVQREDDTPAAIRTRLELYHQHTEPLLHQLGEEGKLVRINGHPPIPDVLRSVLQHTSRLLGQPLPHTKIRF